MMIGSLHTMSYLKPHSWWKNLFVWFKRAQKISIEEQYEKYNVRAFDFHIYFKGDRKRTVFKYGKIDYQTVSTYEILNYLNRQGNSYVRIVLENNANESKEHEAELEAFFYDYCSKIELLYPDVKFFGGYRESDYKRIYNFKHNCPNDLVFYKNVHNFF